MAMNVLVVRREKRGVIGPVDRGRDSSCSSFSLGKSDGRARRLLAAAHPFGVKPVLEFCVSARDEEPLEEVAAVELECAFEIPCGDRIVERDGIAPEATGRNANLLVAARGHNRASEFVPQPAQGL